MSQRGRAMATTKKIKELDTPKPDFEEGDRIAGTLKTKVYTKKYPMKYAHMNDMMRDSVRGMPYGSQAVPMYVGDPDYEDGWEMREERKSNEEFFEVVVPPYKVKNKWLMVIESENANSKEHEVDCADYHLVGVRKVIEPPKPLISNKDKEKLMKLAKPAIVTGIIIAVIAVVGLWLAGNYNSLVKASNAVDNSKAKIDTQLERRYELVDNIVASVEGSQAQESDVFGKIAEARKVGGNATSAGEEANANAQLDQQIALLPRLQEAYPELRSNEQVTRLITELQGTAGQVATSRDVYNDTVTNYNNNITSFPKNIFANLFNFDKRELFKASSEARTNPKVDIQRN